MKLKTKMGKAAMVVAMENVKLLDSKHVDYGPGNISAFGEYGLLVRAHDKIARLTNLLNKGVSPRHESIVDSWRDLANYATIALLVRRGLWK